MHKLRVEDTYFPINRTIRLKDKLFDLSFPKVMGIINCTPDSFFAQSRVSTDKWLLTTVEKFINEGVDILDLGGYSSRPGADPVTEEEEKKRVISALKSIRKEFPTLPLSLDTFRAEVAREGLENGIDIINDISAWEMDPDLLDVVAHYQCPYILMHMKGTPQTMQSDIQYSHLFREIMAFFSSKIAILQEKGLTDIILDPGFGFGKTLEQNHELLHQLSQFQLFGKPILAGISRKSMIYNKLHTSPEEALNGTTVMNTIAILKGASILRVHDVKEAKEVIQLLTL